MRTAFLHYPKGIVVSCQAIMKKLFLVILILLFILSAGCAEEISGEKPNNIELVVSAAASLTDTLNELKSSFEKEYPNITLTFNFGSSGKLAQQIEQGAPVDIFLSASKKFMDQLVNKGMIDNSTLLNFAGNQLVLITEKDNNLEIASFTDLNTDLIKRIAIGNPESVPAGKYAKEIFESIQLWTEIQPKLILAKDVRQVLTYTESGNVDFGVVYFSDTLISDKIKIAAIADENWHKPIIYPGAVTANSKHTAEGKLFLSYLTDEKAKSILNKYGLR